MIFAVDIGNSSIAFGIFDSDGEMLMRSKIEAVTVRSADEYAMIFRGIIQLHGVEAEVDEAIIASVVPSLTHAVKGAIRALYGIQAMEVEPGIKTGLNIKIDVQTQLGADLVANAVAALAERSGPMVIIDFGTATTFTVIDGRGILSGVIIAPGIRLSLDALARGGAELPDISVAMPKRLIAKNTQDSMRAGVLYGHAAMVDGIVERICEELKVDSLALIATGGLADTVLPYCRATPEQHPDLTLKGLRLIREKNRK